MNNFLFLSLVTTLLGDSRVKSASRYKLCYFALVLGTLASVP
jgi:hypothetical protein